MWQYVTWLHITHFQGINYWASIAVIQTHFFILIDKEEVAILNLIPNIWRPNGVGVRFVKVLSCLLEQGTIIKGNESDLMQQMLQMALKLARLDTSKILILGDLGPYGKQAVEFYTQTKTITARWPQETENIGKVNTAITLK